MRVAFVGESAGARVPALVQALSTRLQDAGHELVGTASEEAGLIFNLTDGASPRSHWRRAGLEQFGVTLLALEPNTLAGQDGELGTSRQVLASTYPALLKTLSNGVLAIDGDHLAFVTPEMGVRPLRAADADSLAEELLATVLPLAAARFAIENDVREDLPENLAKSEAVTALCAGGQRLAALGLLPSPVVVDDLLSPEDVRLLRAVYGLQQLSYGNLSVREPGLGGAFWMSGRGVDKGKLSTVGEDVLLVSGHDRSQGRLDLRVPAGKSDARVSVDAIEHALIYETFPQVGAIVHVHAWLEGVDATSQSWPCGTVELAEEVLELVGRQADPGQAEVGLRNHGLTLTGPSLDAIFERVEDRLLKEVPPL